VGGAALRAGVQRIIYLGGLHPESKQLSKHLRSRAEVGDILLDSGVPTAALQAGVIIGSGSTSFEMIRHLTDVLPVMTAPKWVGNLIQPIAVRDVLHYLIGAADLPREINRTFDIGGPDVLTYSQMMNGYAVETGMKPRKIIKLPVLTPYLASQWVNLVTPIPRSLAVPIIASLQHDCVMHEHDIEQFIPAPAGGLTGYRRAVRLALGRMREGEVETSWKNASVAGAPSDPLPSDPDWTGYKVYLDTRERGCAAPREFLWEVVEGIGGENGWYSLPVLWGARGLADKLVGGVGLRRGRVHPERLRVGDALGWNCAPRRTRAAPRATSSARSSFPEDSAAACTGSRSYRSTGSSSAAWRGGSPRRPRPHGAAPRGSHSRALRRSRRSAAARARRTAPTPRRPAGTRSATARAAPPAVAHARGHRDEEDS